MADGSKTEKATPKRRRDERKKGNVPMSKDAVAVATLAGTFGVFWITGKQIAAQLGQFITHCLRLAEVQGQTLEAVLDELVPLALSTLARTVGPLAAVTILCAVAATFAQTKLLVSTESIKPKFSKISPLQGFKRLFSLKSIMEAFKGVFKISILMVIVYFTIKDLVFVSSRLIYADLTAAAAELFSRVMGMVFRIGLAFTALAGFDFFYQRWEYERNLKMSKQEVKDEFKQVEGDPKVKGKIRELQRQRAQLRMMQQVPQADVIIRNPTHYAVALRYKPKQDAAPIVLAKGMDELALRIVKKGEECNITTVENVPLARALYADAQVNCEIPPALYTAVAEVLVYIFRLNEGSNDLVK